MTVEFTNFRVEDETELYSINDINNVTSVWDENWTRVIVLHHNSQWQNEANVSTVMQWIEKNFEPHGKWGVYAYVTKEKLNLQGVSSFKSFRQRARREGMRDVTKIVAGFEDGDDALQFKLMAGANIEDFQDNDNA